MTMRHRVIAVSAASALGLAGAALAAGVALADAGSPAAAPSPGTSTSPDATSHGKSGKAGRSADGHQRGLGLLRAKRLLHGEFVTRGRDGYVTRETQRGTVTVASATSVTVHSADGFTATYSVTTDTKVRGHGGPTTASALRSGDPVAVVATKNGTTLTVDRLRVGSSDAAKADAGSPGKSGSKSETDSD